jgi:hypothetical protein
MKIGQFRSHPIVYRSHPITEEAAADRKITRTDDTSDTDITTGTVDAAATVVFPLIRLLLFSICLCMNPNLVVLLRVLNFGSSSSCFRVLTTNSQVPVVSQTTMQSNLFHSFEVIT